VAGSDPHRLLSGYDRCSRDVPIVHGVESHLVLKMGYIRGCLLVLLTILACILEVGGLL
jgi:hypothetical protein